MPRSVRDGGQAASLSAPYHLDIVHAHAPDRVLRRLDSRHDVVVGDELMPDPLWRRGVDIGAVELALLELEQLLRAVAAKGCHLSIRVDCERPGGVAPKIFTVTVSGGSTYAGPSRFDDSDLARAVMRAVTALDTYGTQDPGRQTAS